MAMCCLNIKTHPSVHDLQTKPWQHLLGRKEVIWRHISSWMCERLDLKELKGTADLWWHPCGCRAHTMHTMYLQHTIKHTSSGSIRGKHHSVVCLVPCWFRSEWSKNALVFWMKASTGLCVLPLLNEGTHGLSYIAKEETWVTHLSFHMFTIWELLLSEPSLPRPLSSGKKPQVALFLIAELNSNCVGSSVSSFDLCSY